MTKKGTFPKVLIHRFCPKIELSFIAVITEIMLEKIVVRYFGQKTIIFRPKNLSFKKSQKMKFSKGGSSWILSWSLFFREIISEKIVFGIVERKEKFLREKN